VLLFLPGTRHLLVWRFKIFMAKKFAEGSAKSFNFGSFGNFGNAGFRYYEYRSAGVGFEEQPPEREVKSADVLDVQPIRITHEDKKPEET
jgi:UPF0716 protein FxsA